jgi:hypothetical protein
MSTPDSAKQDAAAHEGPRQDSNAIAVNVLATTLFGKTRRHLLALLYSNPADRFYLRQLTTAAAVAIGAGQRELAELTAAGIIRREVEGRQVYFQANPACPVFPELQSILRKTTAAGDVVQANAEAAIVAIVPTRRTAARPVAARLSPPPNPAFVWMTRR